jgi:hypothetical protein
MRFRITHTLLAILTLSSLTSYGQKLVIIPKKFVETTPNYGEIISVAEAKERGYNKKRR